MKRAINEAKVFRAWASFELVTLFGTAPVVDHLLEPGEYRLGNSDPAEMWALIENDLNEAINSGTLPSKSDVNDAEGGIRITKETAQAFLGKAYLFEGKNSEAAAMLDNVIKSTMRSSMLQPTTTASRYSNCRSVTIPSRCGTSLICTC